MTPTPSTSMSPLGTAKQVASAVAKLAKTKWSSMSGSQRLALVASAFGPTGGLFQKKPTLASRVLGTTGLFGAGVLVGAATAVLLTPKRGDELRELLLERVRSMTGDVAPTAEASATPTSSEAEVSDEAPAKKRTARSTRSNHKSA